MDKCRVYAVAQVLIAALLFGASAPLSKILLGKVEPVFLASLLYLGSGLGLLLCKGIESFINRGKVKEASLTKNDIPWLIGATLAGGVVAPILLMISLKSTPASTASLLLNFESVTTTLIAIFWFKESVDKKIWLAIVCITLSSVLLSWNSSDQWGFSVGALGIIFACLCWGIDNNFTRNISAKNPVTIVIIKGFVAGMVSLFLAIILKNPMPNIKLIISAMFIGFFCYGVSIVLCIFAMRWLGSSRTSTLFATAPFMGIGLSFLLCGDALNTKFKIALPIMIIGTILLMGENHHHIHYHKFMQHEHRHCHTDGHHTHIHELNEIPLNGYHSHLHIHEEIQHEHIHTPDIHHRHCH